VETVGFSENEFERISRHKIGMYKTDGSWMNVRAAQRMSRATNE
jgi:hypothetical protein